MGTQKENKKILIVGDDAALNHFTHHILNSILLKKKTLFIHIGEEEEATNMYNIIVKKIYDKSISRIYFKQHDIWDKEVSKIDFCFTHVDQIDSFLKEMINFTASSENGLIAISNLGHKEITFLKENANKLSNVDLSAFLNIDVSEFIAFEDNISFFHVISRIFSPVELEKKFREVE